MPKAPKLLNPERPPLLHPLRHEREPRKPGKIGPLAARVDLDPQIHPPHHLRRAKLRTQNHPGTKFQIPNLHHHLLNQHLRPYLQG